MKHLLMLGLIALMLMFLTAWGCGYQSTALENEDAGGLPVDGDADSDIDSDADADSDGDGDEDHVEPEPSCDPQEVAEDPAVGCSPCHPCDPTPYHWNGEACVFSPICCECAGSDCESRFSTLSQCHRAFRGCPTVELEPLFPDAWVVFWIDRVYTHDIEQLLITGEGITRFWGRLPLYPATPDTLDWDYEEDLGVEVANEIFTELEAIDLSDFPHRVDPCEDDVYPEVQLTECPDCEPVSIHFCGFNDLRPEFDPIFALLDERLCRARSNPAYEEWPLP